ncbi:MAG: hypothetical protein ABSC13_01155 [Dehalococcoidia bacterium]|jgi:hypothetical protein
MPRSIKEDVRLASTLGKSAKRAPSIFKKVREKAMETYHGEENRIHRVTTALKREPEKDGDRGVKKAETTSAARPKRSTTTPSRSTGGSRSTGRSRSGGGSAGGQNRQGGSR